MKEAMNRADQEEGGFVFSDFKVQGVSIERLRFRNEQNSRGEVLYVNAVVELKNTLYTSDGRKPMDGYTFNHNASQT